MQIVESRRRGDKVSQAIVRHVGIAQNEEELDQLKSLAEQIRERMESERSGSLPLFAPEELRAAKQEKEVDVELKSLREEQRVVEGIGEVFGELYTQLEFDRIFDNTQDGRNKDFVLKTCVLARLANPTSKLRTAALLEQDYGISLSVDRIYRMMDSLVPKIDKLKQVVCQATLGLLRQDVDVLLYDVTTLHFESQQNDELRNFGFSKNGKFNEVQLVLGLVTSKEGLPLGYELFEGNKAEGVTFVEAIKRFADQFNVSKVICVADRAMFSEKNLLWIEAQSWQFVIAAKLRSMTQAMKAEILDVASYKPINAEEESLRVRSWSLSEKRQLVVSFSEERAKRDYNQRQRLIKRTEKKLNKKTITPAKKLISNRGTAKFLSSSGDEVGFFLDQAKVDADAQWDGLHGVIASSGISQQEALRIYRQLWRIEAAFRLNKHDLKMRPIYHWNTGRVKAHVAICFLAFALARQAEYRVAIQYKKLSFDVIRNELLSVQASILRNIHSKKLYKLPSAFSPAAQKIYQCFGLRRSTKPFAL